MDHRSMLHDLPYLSGGTSRAVTPENPTGEKGRACMAAEGTGAGPARHLGRGWKLSPSIVIPRGETAVLADIAAQGEINSMWIGGDITRAYILRIYWDGDPQPAVECPLTDFFANGWIDNRGSCFRGPFFPLNTLPVCINPNNGLNCFWQMPFEKGFKVTLENTSAGDLCCYYQINFTERDLPQRPLYFHAQYRQSDRVPLMENHTILGGVKGRGCYVGTSMAVELHGNDIWWGEGEVKFFLDGDTEFPTVSSTGTEDYFLGSYDWEIDGKYTPYSCPYGGMFYVSDPDVLAVRDQRFALCRWHLPDPIRFGEDIRVEVQDLGWEVLGEKYEVRSDYMSSVAYFYLDSTSADRPALPETIKPVK